MATKSTATAEAIKTATKELTRENRAESPVVQALNGQDYGGRPMKVNEAKPQEKRSGGGGRGGYGGGGGGGGGRW